MVETRRNARRQEGAAAEEAGAGNGAADEENPEEDEEQEEKEEDVVAELLRNTLERVSELDKELKEERLARQRLEARVTSVENRPAEANRPSGTPMWWAWKALTHIGEEFFQLLEAPWKEEKLKYFLLSGESLLDLAPPLRERYNLCRRSPVTREAYASLVLTLHQPPDVLPAVCRSVLVELLALYLVSRDSVSPLTVRQYLVLGTCERARAKTITEKALDNAPESRITMALEGLLRDTDVLKD